MNNINSGKRDKFGYSIANKQNHFDKEFSEGGMWEIRNGRKQTQEYAGLFVRDIKIPLNEFSLLDVGCALGDSIPVLKKAYPMAKLFGCDVSRTAIERCKKDYGEQAEFFAAAFEDISGFWDVIYCSHTIEHFADYKRIASWLLSKCNILYIIVPYYELKNGKPLDPLVEKGHMATFYRDTFNDLYEKGELLKPVKVYIAKKHLRIIDIILLEFKRAMKLIRYLRYFPPPKSQITYELINKNYSPKG